MVSGFWMRLGKFGLVLLGTYLLLAYILVVTIIIREELPIVDAGKVVSVLKTAQGTSTLEGQLRNVFGDPVPFGVVILDDQLVQADNTGAFRITNLNPGRFVLEIFAGDYARYTREIQIEEGINHPTIKYETGLWPQVFLVDFHIFYKGENEIFGMVGFANGTGDSIYIERASIIDPNGEVVTDVLHDNDGFQYYTDLSNRLAIIEEPQKALKWAPNMVQGGEFPPVRGYFPPGPYTIEVHYAFQEGHELGQYQVLTITDHLDLDNSWVPHLPLER
ncbi:MAG: carboxypeptidase regulatory-like domain-containing protein [Firmicutes bacterium]|nr:carboxypeptidase regulatory-like domain-containing protein [Bacillota bacterium]